MMRIAIVPACGRALVALALATGAAKARAAEPPPVPPAEPSLLESLDLFAAELDRLQTDLEQSARLQEQLEGLSRRLSALEASLARSAPPPVDPGLPRPPAAVIRLPQDDITPAARAALPPLPDARDAPIIVPPPEATAGDPFPRIDDFPSDSMPLPRVDVASHGCLQRWLRGGRPGRAPR
ncbi:MAG: hypothetical protein EBR86_04230 [Planctomycetia bacterium]|nr:hypothetical protein [Planctomycetia bacterium]